MSIGRGDDRGFVLQVSQNMTKRMGEDKVTSHASSGENLDVKVGVTLRHCNIKP